MGVNSFTIHWLNLTVMLFFLHFNRCADCTGWYFSWDFLRSYTKWKLVSILYYCSDFHLLFQLAVLHCVVVASFSIKWHFLKMANFVPSDLRVGFGNLDLSWIRRCVNNPTRRSECETHWFDVSPRKWYTTDRILSTPIGRVGEGVDFVSLHGNSMGLVCACVSIFDNIFSTIYLKSRNQGEYWSCPDNVNEG